MTTERIPAEVFHPGVFIREELAARGWQQQELARRVSYSQSYLSDVITGRRGMSAHLALALEAVLGTSAAYWLHLDVAYRLHLERQRRQEQEQTR